MRRTRVVSRERDVALVLHPILYISEVSFSYIHFDTHVEYSDICHASLIRVSNRATIRSLVFARFRSSFEERARRGGVLCSSFRGNANEDAEKMSTKNEEETTLRVSPWFPNAPSDCRKVADTFFDCFSKYSLVHGDEDAGDVDDPERKEENRSLKALAQCVSEMSAYDNCMRAYLETNKEKMTTGGNESIDGLRLYRVEEQYRAKK